MELFCDPPIHGREDAGHSSTASSHQPADTIAAPSAAKSCSRRLPNFGGPASKYIAAMGGTTSMTWSCLVRNPNPTNTPVSTSHRVRPSSTARIAAQTAAIMSSTRRASGLLNRNIKAATGVTASVSPASRPAAAPNCRRMVAHSNATEPTPRSACGTSIAHELSPKMRTDKDISHNDIGGLSTVIALAASEEPKKNAFHDTDPAWTAAE